MASNTDILAKHVRELIIEIENLTYVYNDIQQKYIGYNYDELDDENHPLVHLDNSISSLNKVKDFVLRALIAENISCEDFHKSLKKLATIDALKDGSTDFVEYIKKFNKD